jgi:tetratricopeptide (TPR) repeat protein
VKFNNEGEYNIEVFNVEFRTLHGTIYSAPSNFIVFDMKKSCVLVISLFLLGCNSLDDSNPSEVLEKYIKYRFDNKFEERYELISSESKEVCSKGEFLKYFENSDTVEYRSKEIKSIEELNRDNDYPSYKRFRTENERISMKGDTLHGLAYLTLRNENGKWRVVWNYILLQQASQMYNDGEYSRSIELSQRARDINPFSAEAYSRIGWCYARDGSLDFETRKVEMLKNFKYAVRLEPDVPDHYNSLATYFGFVDIPEMEIENYEKAIQLTRNEEAKSYLYSNLSTVYQRQEKFEEATLAIETAVGLDSTNTHGWYRWGSVLMAQENFDLAKAKFEFAMTKKEMSSVMHFSLLRAHAISCFNLKDYACAKESILRALEIEPSDEQALWIYRQVKDRELVRS